MSQSKFQVGDWVSWPNHHAVVRETPTYTVSGHTYLSVVVKSVYNDKTKKWKWANYVDAVDADLVERMKRYDPKSTYDN